MLFLILAGCSSKSTPEAPPAPATVPPAPSAQADRASAPVPAAGMTVTGQAKLTVGDPILVCARRAPAFQPGAYQCGPTELTVIAHSTGPTLTEEQVWSILSDVGLDPSQPISIQSLSPGDDPNTALSSGLSIREPTGTAGLLPNYVFELSDGRRAVFLSQRIP